MRRICGVDGAPLHFPHGGSADVRPWYQRSELIGGETMRPRGLRAAALSLAVLAATACLAIAAFLWVPLPKSAWTHLVGTYPEHFVTDRLRTQNDRSPAEQLLLRAAGLKLQADWSRRTYRRIARGTTDDLDFVARATAAVGSGFLTQRHMPMREVDNTLDVFLVRGYGYCDYINGALGLLLSRRLQDVALYATRTDIDAARHSVVRARLDDGELFADAWGDAALFGLEERLGSLAGRVATFAEADRLIQRGTPGATAEDYRNGVAFNRYDTAYRLRKAVERIWHIAGGGPDGNGAGARGRSPPPAPAGAAGASTGTAGTNDRDLLVAFLEGRVEHLFGATEAALQHYRTVAASGCEADFCRAAARFAALLENLPPPVAQESETWVRP